MFSSLVCLLFLDLLLIKESNGYVIEAPALNKVISMDCGKNYISVYAASYGELDCINPITNNQLKNLQNACNGVMTCNYLIDYKIVGDPVKGCAKNYFYKKRCVENTNYDPTTHRDFVSSEASGKVLSMNCGRKVIKVLSATYGQNCGAPVDKQLNHIKVTCDNKHDCNYKIDHNIIGDPVHGCAKDYIFKYQCVYKTSPVIHVGKYSAEASSQTLKIRCDKDRIRIISATYGGNCGLPKDNQLKLLGNICNDEDLCEWPIHGLLNYNGNYVDPKPGCDKDYEYQYQCIFD